MSYPPNPQYPPNPFPPGFSDAALATNLKLATMIKLLIAALIIAFPMAAASQPTGLGYTSPEKRRPVPDDGWRDPAPHKPLGVYVAKGVRIHLLDFGGKGTPLVFLSGIGNNAHVFDDFAQRFTRRNRVIAITRRGFGESSHPEDGYDQATLARDVITVLDSLGIRRAVFAGHSIGGYELTHIAANYPERVLGLIYLDGGSDPVSADSIRHASSELLASLEVLPRPPAAEQILPGAADSVSAKAAWAYRMRVGLTDNTESAVRAAYFYEGFNPYRGNNNPSPPKMMAAIRAGGPTPFNRVKAPAVFIFAETSAIEHLPAFAREWAGSNPDRRLALQRSIDVTGAVVRAQREHILSELKGSRMVTIPGARHLIFKSNPVEVEKIMKQFLTGL